MTGPTLVKPPPQDTTKAPIENILELTDLSIIQPDLFTNTREVWRPPNARGIFGGIAISQCLAAAFRTVPPPSPANNHAVFLPHSMHCYFVLAGDHTIPIIYAVERVREGRSFLTRTVQARQRGKCIFTTTISFMAEGAGGSETVQHGPELPADAEQALQDILRKEESDASVRTKAEEEEKNVAEHNGVAMAGPFMSRRMRVNDLTNAPHERKQRLWLKCHGQLSSSISTHLAALAYMSDSRFIGTVPQVHRLQRFSPKSTLYNDPSAVPPPQPEGGVNTPERQPERGIGMMVSLDHTIYFHRPREVKVDEWMYSEMASPWAGEGRGLVMQRMWNRQGVLVATCVQEGLVRLKQDEGSASKL